jgi:poly-gamma-glutamate capsule biosynthesis protein CapA/YwtB (metallophosphatase superfamily)
MRRIAVAFSLALSTVVACSHEGRAPAPQASAKQQHAVKLTAVGDILLGDASQSRLDREGWDYPFRALASLLESSDLVFGNLEGPITEQTKPLDGAKDYVYKSKPPAAAALGAAHVGLLNLANNHALDYGDAGLADTIRNLDAAGLRHFGAGKGRAEAIGGEIVELAGIKIGFLGFMEKYGPYGTTYSHYFAKGENPGVAELHERWLREAIGAMRPKVDVLIVSCHWGKNYAEVTKTQQRYGHLAAELGADLVIGHHPHVAQGLEVHDGVPIVYSLGNFTFGSKGRFDQLDPLLRRSWIAEITVSDRRVAAVDLIPLEVDNKVVHYQPRVASDVDLAAMIQKLNEPFGTAMEISGSKAHLEVAARELAAR